MKNWRNAIIPLTGTMQKAIELLNSESLRIVLVVDNEQKLVGTITDGDIRRALLRHCAMGTKVTDFMYQSPTVAYEEDNQEAILDKMRDLDLLQIPILNHQNQLVGLETVQHLLSRQRLDNPVFLMAGGFGTRLRPLTEHAPKPLLQVGSRPILETILEQFIEAGFHRFYISTHYRAEMVREHFGDGSEWDVSIQYVHEHEPLGTAGAIGLLPKDLPDLPILMMNGDLLTKIDFVELLNFHSSNGGDATMCVREYDFQVPYGVIKEENGCIASIVEKPIHKFFVNAGVYVLSSSIVEDIDGSSYLDMPHMLEERISNNGQVNMFPIHEYWLDIGQMDQFEQAQIDASELFG